MSKRPADRQNLSASDGDACCSVAQEIAEELCEGYHQEQEGKEKAIKTHQAMVLIEQAKGLAIRSNMQGRNSDPEERSAIWCCCFKMAVAEK